MTWSIEWDDRARRELRALDRQVQRRILRYTGERLVSDPRSHGRLLQGSKSRLWRFRVGHYRLVCSLEDDRLVVLVLRVGHRSRIYR
ncbi:MAG: type II toxin-antitoxin system RelE/ParE family toxin [Acidobacteriota bacterium]